MHLPGIPTELHDWPDTESIRLKGGVRWKFRNYLIQSDSSLQGMVDVLRQYQELAYDTEGSGLKPHLGDRICGHSATVQTDDKELSNFYVPVRHQGPANQQETQLPVDVVSSAFSSVFERKPITRGHHLKFDALMARADGIILAGPWQDTSIKAIIHNENEKSFALKKLTAKHVYGEARNEEEGLHTWLRKDAHTLKMAYKKRKRVAGDLIGQPTYLEKFGYSRTPVPLCGVYACHDTGYTWLLDDFYTPLILPEFEEVYRREIGISWYLHEMEWWGVPQDVDEIQRAAQLIEEDVAYWQSEVNRMAGYEVDPTSENLKDLFYNRCGMTAMKVTQNEQPSVDKEARKLLQGSYPTWAPLIHAIDKLSTAQKIHSTYAGSWLRYVTPSGRVHSSYNQLEGRDEEGVPVTGRLSSSDPNAQNVASRPAHLHNCGCAKCLEDKYLPFYTAPTDRIPDLPATISVRRYYTVPSGWARFYIDLSQIELRVLAALSQDPVLLHCYANDLDVHQITADQVTGGNRKIAKEVNFGNNYGMSKFGLSKRLPHYADEPERALEDAEKYLEKFFQTYARVPIFRDQLANEMAENDCMFINMFGRPRRIEDIGSDDWRDVAAAKRKMMSSIISGTAADMNKEIMLRTGVVLQNSYASRPYEEQGKMVQTIHDEDVYDLPVIGCTQVLPQLMHCFTHWPEFEAMGVPIRASIEVSTTTWEDKRAIKLLPDGNFVWAE